MRFACLVFSLAALAVASPALSETAAAHHKALAHKAIVHRAAGHKAKPHKAHAAHRTTGHAAHRGIGHKAEARRIVRHAPEAVRAEAPRTPLAPTAHYSLQSMPRLPGYLGEQGVPNSIAILPPPPPPGSTAEKLDNEVYADTRALQGTPRWAMATRDATDYVQAFDCPLGLKLETANIPEVNALFLRVARDASAITNLSKDHFKHPRPFIAPNGPICTENLRAELIKSPSYPSGHTTYSWAMGLILAEMAPDHAADILARARAFGESRVVCGVHTVSDIEAGRANGAALVAVLHSNPQFRSDLEAAKKALALAEASTHAAPDAAQCKIEMDAAAHTPWINPTGEK
jgi:acid phosphatase (class A)